MERSSIELINFKLINYELNDKSSCYLAALGTTLIFSLVFYFLSYTIDLIWNKKNEQLLKKNYEEYLLKKEIKFKSKLDKENYLESSYWTTKNLQISFIHSALSSICIIYLFIKQSYMFNDLLTYITYESYLCVAFSCGYFLYDFYDMYLNNKLIKEWFVTLHHLIVLALFEYHLINLCCIGYSLIALFMEFNSIFLHARKLLKYYGFDKSSLVTRLNVYINIITFILFRFGILTFIAMHTSYFKDRVTKNYLIFLITCTFSMACINIGIFFVIILKDLIKYTKSSSFNLKKTL
jgi:hypothetical protein